MSKWNIRPAQPRDDEIIVDPMSSTDIRKYFPDHVREDMTARMRTLPEPDTDEVAEALDRAAHK
jgi:hypothetical protein